MAPVTLPIIVMSSIFLQLSNAVLNPTDSTQSPSVTPTQNPTAMTSHTPSRAPTQSPTLPPTSSPTDSPSPTPTESPSAAPTDSPSNSPSESPSRSPSDSPSKSPTSEPSYFPSISPSDQPSETPTDEPTTSKPTSYFNLNLKWNDPSESDDGAGSETTADVPMEPLLTTIDIWNDDTDPVGDAVLELQLNVTDLDPDGAIGAVENVVNELDTMDMYDFVEWSLSKWWIVYAAVFSMGFITASSLLAVVVYTMKCHKAKLQYRRARVIELAAQRKQTNDNMKPLESYCMEITDSEQVILVTGGVGFFGGHIAEHLLKRGHRVVVYDIFNSETTPSAEKRETADVLIKTATEHKDKGSTLKIVNGDICDAVKLESVVKSEGITACFNMAALVNDRRSVTHPTDFIDVNIKGTVNLLRILGEHGVKTVVHASTRSVFGQVVNNNTEWDENAPRLPINPYGATKVATDAFLHVYAHLYGMNVSIIRSSAAYGPRGRLDMFPRICVHRIQNGITINKFGDGSATRTWIYIDDVVSAFLMAFQAMECGKLKGFNEFNIGTEALTTLNEMIETAERVVGKQAVIKQQDVPKGDTHMVGQPKWDKIRTCLGWTPKMSLEDGLRMSLEYSKQKEKRKSNSECINCEL